MKIIAEYRTVDKTDWARGPWDSEPDKIQMKDEATGLPCLIVRGPVGALCGYVGVPEGHPWHGQHYDSVGFGDKAPDEYDPDWYPDWYPDVHGGLTFSDGCHHDPDPAKGICHVPQDGEPDNVWWLGFDCAHCDDLINMSSSLELRELYPSRGIYRDVDYVKAECAKLAQQVARAA